MPPLHRFAAFFLLLCCWLPRAFAQSVTVDDFEARTFTNTAGESIPYRLYLPAGYDPAQQYPLVLFLHGMGERGSDNRLQLTGQTAPLVFVQPTNQSRWPCIMVAPQCPVTDQWVAQSAINAGALAPTPTTSLRLAVELVDALRQQYSVDPARRIVTGLSLGGYGCWEILTRYPDAFTAAAPICGGGDAVAVAASVATRVWAFHCADDPTVPVQRTRSLVAALRLAGKPTLYTEYGAVGHFSWIPAYNDPLLLPWLFDGAPEPPAPSVALLGLWASVKATYGPNTLYGQIRYQVPDPTAAPMLLWSQESGPGVATFSDPAVAQPSVTFSQPGTYTLRFTVGDGSQTFSDQIAVTVTAPALASLTLNPTTVIGGVASKGTVTLSGVAPPGGVDVALASSDPAAGVPAGVTIPAGAKSATFNIATLAVSADTPVSVTASLGPDTRTAALTVKPPTLSTLTLNPPSLIGGATSKGTVALSGVAPSGGAVVALSSNSSAAIVPSSVTVPAGAKTATYTITTSAVGGDAVATLGATLAGVTKTAPLTIKAPVVATLALNPTSLTGGSASVGTVTLTGVAPVGGVVVALASSSATATVPAQVTVAGGAKTATFSVGTTPVATTEAIVLSANAGGVTKSATLTVKAPATATFALNPASLTGGGVSQGTVTLTGVAPAGGVSVALSSNSPAAVPPPTVTVAAGAKTATFAIATTPVGANVSATLSAATGGVTKTVLLTVKAPIATTFTLSPTSVIGGNAAQATITLTGPAPDSGASIALTSNHPAAAPPSVVTVPAGATAVTFAVQTNAVSANVNATLSAVTGGATKTALLTVKAPILLAVSLSPNSVQGGSSTLGTVTLSGIAPAAGISVAVRTNDPSVTVPATVTVPAGRASATFAVSTPTVTAQKSVTVSVQLAITLNAILTVTP